jgi:bifunctional UDP-N-acetylglucosamine pyrophosphorylase/glucosamine-1-phosphate N-acetyltransferase
MKQNIQAIVLAAGKSTRLKTGRSKLIEEICGQPMIVFSTKLLKSLNIPTTVVVGHQKELIESTLKKYKQQVDFVTQDTKNKGTGHALLCTKEQWNKDHILVLNGDMPLVTSEIIQSLYTKHIESHAAISFVMAHNTDPATGYGRVIKTDSTIKIVEAKEFNEDASEHCCINAGIYLIKRDFLEKHSTSLKQNETSSEYHITDLVAIANENNYTVSTTVASFDHVRGVNNQHELWAAEQIQRSNIIKHWMENGVRFSVAHNVHIDLDIEIGAGTYIGCGVHILYGSKIGNNCKIHEYSSLEGTVIGDNTEIMPFTIVKNATVGDNCQVGPFAHIQEETIIEDSAVIGNFVEIKRSTIGAHSKAKHLSYIGDTKVGTSVNIGAGTITCNFDGKNKNKTVIKDNVFIGSNNTIVAPVTIEQNSFTAAGSTITKDVPCDTLAIERGTQINKMGYTKKMFENKQTEPCKATDITHKKTEFMGAVRTSNDPIENDL